MSSGHKYFLAVIWAVMLVALVSPQPALSQERHALVIGNSAYRHTSVLPNPVRDADLVAETLIGVGFKVTKVINATREQMMRSMLEFARSVRQSNSVALFYFAGHGVQVNGLNYLVPVDADIRSEDEARIQAISAGEFLQTLEDAGTPRERMNIIILDACRNNPFSTGWRSIGRGLAPIDAPTGSIVAFSTAPGTVAYDGKGANSPYAEGLTQAIRQPGLSIEHVFKSVRTFVTAAVTKEGRTQVPWESTSLIGEFYFVGPGAPQNAPAEPPRTMESVMQEIHRDTRTEQIVASKRGPSWVKISWIRPTSIPADEECEIDLSKAKIEGFQHEGGTLFGDACTFSVTDSAQGRGKSVFLWGKAAPGCYAYLYIRDKNHLTCISIQSRLEFLVRQAKTGAAKPEPQRSTTSEHALRLQGTLQKLGCYKGQIDGLWGKESEQALARFSRENGQELESLGPTIENIIRIEGGGISVGCNVTGSTASLKAPEVVKGCVPNYGAKIFTGPDRNKEHPDWTGELKIGTSWSLMDAQVVGNSTGRYIYGKLYSPRGGYQKWVYALAEDWKCQ